ncbi:MAG: MerR family transcriptional regulator [Gemmatimonadales bacterium]
MTDEKRHPIQVVARRTGLSADVLRAWEKRYGAVTPERAAGRRRLYSGDDIERLRLLKRVTAAGRAIGQVAGLSTEQLAAMVREDEAEEVAAPVPGADTPGIASAEQFLERAVQAVRDLDAPRLESLLSVAVVAMRLDRLMTELVVPLLERIGELWEGGELTVAHEHVASAVMRQLLGAMVAGWEGRGGAPTVVAATPQGERHEFGAMMVAASAVAAGWRVVYAGPDLPASDVAEAARQQGARAVALSVVSSQGAAGAANEVAVLRRSLPDDVTLLVGGRAAGERAGALEEVGAVVLTDLAGLRQFLASAGGGLAGA